MKRNILIVDDSNTICNSLKSLLDEIPNFNTLIANSKKQCQKILLNKRLKIDVALLDLGLPDAPNGEVVDIVAKFAIPSIVLTGSIDKEELFRDKKIVDYVIKDGSFSFSYAVSLVQRVIKNENIKVILCSKDMLIGSEVSKLLNQYRLNCLFARDHNKIDDLLKQNNDIKIIILDDNLNNIDLVKSIRLKYKKESLHILTINDFNNRSNGVKLLKYGVNQLLYKNFSSEEFFSVIKSHLDSIEYNDDIYKKANIDFLTGAYNRRYFFNEGNKRFLKEKNVKLCMIDIDKFKIINDTYGHEVGDIVIQEVVLILKNELINDDCIISRFGGEEFCVMFFNMDEKEFLYKIESIRAKYEKNIIVYNNKDILFTVSIGYITKKLQTIDMMIIGADKGLYKAKNSGRNQARS